MRRYNITHDAKTTAGGKVVATTPGATIDGKLVAREATRSFDQPAAPVGLSFVSGRICIRPGWAARQR